MLQHKDVDIIFLQRIRALIMDDDCRQIRREMNLDQTNKWEINQTPFYIHARNESPPLRTRRNEIYSVLDRDGVDSYQDRQCTILHVAIVSNSEEVVKWALQQGANVHTVHYDGFDSWQLAARVGDGMPDLLATTLPTRAASVTNLDRAPYGGVSAAQSAGKPIVYLHRVKLVQLLRFQSTFWLQLNKCVSYSLLLVLVLLDLAIIRGAGTREPYNIVLLTNQQLRDFPFKANALETRTFRSITSLQHYVAWTRQVVEPFVHRQLVRSALSADSMKLDPNVYVLQTNITSPGDQHCASSSARFPDMCVAGDSGVAAKRSFAPVAAWRQFLLAGLEETDQYTGDGYKLELRSNSRAVSFESLEDSYSDSTRSLSTVLTFYDKVPQEVAQLHFTVEVLPSGAVVPLYRATNNMIADQSANLGMFGSTAAVLLIVIWLFIDKCRVCCVKNNALTQMDKVQTVLGFVWDAVLVLLFACQGAIYMALAMVESTKCCGDEFTIPKNATGFREVGQLQEILDFKNMISGMLLVMLAFRMVMIVKKVPFLQPLFVSVGAAARNTLVSVAIIILLVWIWSFCFTLVLGNRMLEFFDVSSTFLEMFPLFIRAGGATDPFYSHSTSPLMRTIFIIVSMVLFRIIMDHMLGNQLVGGSLCAIEAAKRQQTEPLGRKTVLRFVRKTLEHRFSFFDQKKRPFAVTKRGLGERLKRLTGQSETSTLTPLRWLQLFTEWANECENSETRKANMNNNQRKVGTMLATDFLEHTLYLRKEHVRAILLRFCDPSEYRPSNARGADYQVQVLWDRMADLHVSEAQRHRAEHRCTVLTGIDQRPDDVDIKCHIKHSLDLEVRRAKMHQRFLHERCKEEIVLLRNRYSVLMSEIDRYMCFSCHTRIRNCTINGCGANHVSVCETCAKYGPSQSADDNNNTNDMHKDTLDNKNAKLRCPFRDLNNKSCDHLWIPGEYEKVFL